MSISRKYGRTYHYPFSLGTTSDDRINYDWYEDLSKINKVIHTEKLDGENTCINYIGVFARSHAAPTRNPWSNYLKPLQQQLKNDLKQEDLEIFGENLYAKHSIEYKNLDNHFFVFGMRKKDKWLSWEEIEEYCFLFDLKTAPILEINKVSDFNETEYKEHILKLVDNHSKFNSFDVQNNKPCNMEGLVTRNIKEFDVYENGKINKSNVFKWVRENHVKTDEHWVRNWKRAKLNWEK